MPTSWRDIPDANVTEGAPGTAWLGASYRGRDISNAAKVLGSNYYGDNTTAGTTNTTWTNLLQQVEYIPSDVPSGWVLRYAFQGQLTIQDGDNDGYLRVKIGATEGTETAFIEGGDAGVWTEYFLHCEVPTASRGQDTTITVQGMVANSAVLPGETTKSVVARAHQSVASGAKICIRRPT